MKNKARKAKRGVVVNMKSGTFIILLLIALLVGLMIFGSFRTGNSNSIKEVRGDVFEGVITNINLEPQVLDGTGVYDKSCLSVENGLSQCDAGIQTEKGLLNFNYKHNMNMQKCLDNGQKLKVEILADNQARVTRL